MGDESPNVFDFVCPACEADVSVELEEEEPATVTCPDCDSDVSMEAIRALSRVEEGESLESDTKAVLEGAREKRESTPKPAVGANEGETVEENPNETAGIDDRTDSTMVGMGVGDNLPARDDDGESSDFADQDGPETRVADDARPASLDEALAEAEGEADDDAGETEFERKRESTAEQEPLEDDLNGESASDADSETPSDRSTSEAEKSGVERGPGVTPAPDDSSTGIDDDEIDEELAARESDVDRAIERVEVSEPGEPSGDEVDSPGTYGVASEMPAPSDVASEDADSEEKAEGSSTSLPAPSSVTDDGTDEATAEDEQDDGGRDEAETLEFDKGPGDAEEAGRALAEASEVEAPEDVVAEERSLDGAASLEPEAIVDAFGEGKLELRTEGDTLGPIEGERFVEVVQEGFLPAVEAIREPGEDWIPADQHPVVEAIREKLAERLRSHLARREDDESRASEDASPSGESSSGPPPTPGGPEGPAPGDVAESEGGALPSEDEERADEPESGEQEPPESDSSGEMLEDLEPDSEEEASEVPPSEPEESAELDASGEVPPREKPGDGDDAPEVPPPSPESSEEGGESGGASSSAPADGAEDELVPPRSPETSSDPGEVPSEPPEPASDSASDLGDLSSGASPDAADSGEVPPPSPDQETGEAGESGEIPPPTPEDSDGSGAMSVGSEASAPSDSSQSVEQIIDGLADEEKEEQEEEHDEGAADEAGDEPAGEAAQSDSVESESPPEPEHIPQSDPETHEGPDGEEEAGDQPPGPPPESKGESAESRDESSSSTPAMVGAVAAVVLIGAAIVVVFFGPTESEKTTDTAETATAEASTEQESEASKGLVEATDRARRVLHGAVEVDVGDAELQMRVAERLVQEGRHGAASRIFDVQWRHEKGPADRKFANRYAELLMEAGRYARLRDVTVEVVQADESADEFRELYTRAARNDPELQPDGTVDLAERGDFAEIGPGDDFDLDGWIVRDDDGEPVAYFNPERSDDRGWRDDIAAWRLCELLACQFEIPKTSPARIAEGDFDELVGEGVERSDLQWERLERDGETEKVLYGALRQWPGPLIRWPIEAFGVWRPWLHAYESTDVYERPAAKELKSFRELEGRDFYDEVASELNGATVRDLARQISGIVSFDYLTNNWERFADDEAKYGTRNHFRDGTFVTVRTDTAFQGRKSTRVKGRFNWISRFSRDFVDSVRLLDRETAESILYPEASALEQRQLEIFWEQRESMLERVEKLVDEHGRNDVLIFE